MTAVDVVYDDMLRYSRHNVLAGRIEIPVSLQNVSTPKAYSIMNRGKPSLRQIPSLAVLVANSAAYSI